MHPTDPNHEALRIDFTQRVETHPGASAQAYIKRYGPILSLRQACELSNTYSNSDQARGYYRTAVLPAAKLIIQYAWQTLLQNLQKPLKHPPLPVLIVAGGGPGSGKLTAIRNPLLSLKKHVLFIYDASEESINELQLRITDLHSLNIPVVLAYICRPLPQAARATILRNIAENIAPDRATFGTQHFECQQLFLSLIKFYSKQKRLFSSTVIPNPGHPDNLHTSKPNFLQDTLFTIKEAEEIFIQVQNEITGIPTSTIFYSPEMQITISNKKQRAPRPAKSLTGQSTLIGYLLAQSLRNTLIASEQTHSRSPTHLDQRNPSTSESPAPPTKSLVHTKTFATKDETIDITNTQGQTAKGQERILNNERPERTVVRETSTNMHEMETVRIR